MRIKILLILFGVLLISGLDAFAQFYSFLQLQEKYNSLGNNAKNELIYLGSRDSIRVAIPIGFHFRFHNEEIDSLCLVKVPYDSPGFYLPEPTRHNDVYNTIDIRVDAQVNENTYLQNFSPLHYKYQTSGSIGDQIFVLEWENMSYYSKYSLNANCPDGCINDTTTKYLFNYQLWLYEKNGDIEIRFGNSNFPENAYTLVSINRSKYIYTNLTGSDNNFYPAKHEKDSKYTFSGWPLDSTVFKFSCNSSNQIFLNDYFYVFNRQDVIPGFGALIGHNNFLDYEWAEKFYNNIPMHIKGMICQNYGSSGSDDSASFKIYSIGIDGLPDQVVYETRRPYKCLKLDGTLNYIAFDSAISVRDSFFVSFGLNPYLPSFIDTIGLSASQNDFIDSPFGSTSVRCFNNKWYDVYSMLYLSSWNDGLTHDFDRLHFDLAPVVNFDFNNMNKPGDTLLCESSVHVHSINDSKFSNCMNKRVIVSFSPVVASEKISFSFRTEVKDDVVVKIIDLYGRQIDCFFYSNILPGEHSQTINIQKYTNGLYHVIFQQNNYIESFKFIVNK
jgi:hypothetical protein